MVLLLAIKQYNNIAISVIQQFGLKIAAKIRLYPLKINLILKIDE
jgi:hypothetical protein